MAGKIFSCPLPMGSNGDCNGGKGNCGGIGRSPIWWYKALMLCWYISHGDQGAPNGKSIPGPVGIAGYMECPFPVAMGEVEKIECGSFSLGRVGQVSDGCIWESVLVGSTIASGFGKAKGRWLIGNETGAVGKQGFLVFWFLTDDLLLFCMPGPGLGLEKLNCERAIPAAV